MGYIIEIVVADQVAFPGNLHRGNIDLEAHVRLVVLPVPALVHSVAGMDVQEISGLAHPQASGAKRVYGIMAFDAQAVDPVPVFGVPDHTDHFHIVAFLGVFISHNQEIIILSAKVSAPQRKLQLQCLFPGQLQIRGIQFEHRILSHMLHAKQGSVIVGGQIGIHRRGITIDILPGFQLPSSHPHHADKRQ